MAYASIVIGILAIVFLCVSLPPCLGGINYINIPFALLGLVLGGLALGFGTDDKEETDRALGGLIVNAVVIVLGIVRLVIGGFLF